MIWLEMLSAVALVIAIGMMISLSIRTMEEIERFERDETDDMSVFSWQVYTALNMARISLGSKR